MTPTGNLSLIQVGEEPGRSMQNNNKNKNNKKKMAGKEGATDSTDSMTRVISTPTTTTAEKGDDTDSTATVTAAAATSFCASEWDDDIMAALENSTALNVHIYVFGKRRWLKPDRKWRTPTPHANSAENIPRPTQQVKHNQKNKWSFHVWLCS